jgi:O-antigen biosynthesis protein
MDSLPNIGLIGQGWTPDVGGVESVLEHLARTLVARGHAVHVLALDRTTDRDAWSPRDAIVRGIHVRRLAIPNTPRATFEDDLFQPAANVAVERWARAFELGAVEVHHMSGFGTGILPVLARLNIPTAVTLHDPWVICPRGQMWHAEGGSCKRVDPRACAQCAHATWPSLSTDPGAVEARLNSARQDLATATVRFASSQSLAATLRAAGIPNLNVRTPAIDMSRLAGQVEHLRAGRPPGRRLGVLGSVQPSKGVLELAQAVLATDLPGLTLEVHGPRGDYHGDSATSKALESLAAVHPRIRLHGPYALHERATVLATLDAVAVPSLWDESFGLSAREARAASLPVLATRVGGLCELDGDRGVRFLDPRTPDSWPGALRSMVFGPIQAPQHDSDIASSASAALNWLVRSAARDTGSVTISG